MSFVSQYAVRIWEDLHDVLIPDQMTLNPAEIRTFGIRSSGDKKVDAMMASNFILVKIPIIDILKYFDHGIDIQIPSRETMIKIYKDIQLYLDEWQEHIKTDINSSAQQHKNLLSNLDKLAKRIHEKADGKELKDSRFSLQSFGLTNPLLTMTQEKDKNNKPDYVGIAQLLRPKVAKGRY